MNPINKKNIISASDDKAFKLTTTIKEKEDSQRAVLNVLEDLNIEKTRLAKIKVRDEAILSSIGDGIIATDSGKRIIVMNKIAEKLLGWKIDEAIGKLHDEVILLEDEKGTFVPPEKKPLAKAFSSTTTKLYLLSKNKIKFPVAITVSPIILDNKIIGAVEVFRDITQEKAIAKMKDEFLSVASHELRTPMTAIKGFLDMVIKEQVGKISTVKMKKYLEMAYEGNERMIKLVNDLLNVSRIEAGRMKFDLTDVQMEKIIEQTIAELAKIAQSKGLHLKFEKPEKPLPMVVAATDKIQMVLTNIIGNGLKFTEKGEVKIWTKTDKKLITIYIQDTGGGIAEKDQDKLFQKFSQIDTTISGSVKGTGLGLYISKMIIEKLGGKIWCKSKGKGKGSTFSFSLPIKESLSSKKVIKTIQKEAREHPDQK